MSKLSNIVKIVKMLIRSCFLITLIKCLKGHKSLGLFFVCQVVKSSVTQWLSEWQGHLLSCSGQLKRSSGWEINYKIQCYCSFYSMILDSSIARCNKSWCQTQTFINTNLIKTNKWRQTNNVRKIQCFSCSFKSSSSSSP